MKRPSVSLSSVVGRMTAELLVIVAGVLIALGAQSWWEDRQLEEDRAAVAQALGDDMARALDELTTDLTLAQARREDIRWMLDPATDFGAASDSVWARRVKEGLWQVSGSRVSVPAWEELKGSGRLGLLPPELRTAMSEFQGLLAPVFQASDDIFQYQIRNLDPWLLDHAPLRYVLCYDQEEGLGRPERLPDAVLRSRRVENMLLAKLELLTTLQRRATVARTKAEDVLRLLGKPVPEDAPVEAG